MNWTTDKPTKQGWYWWRYFMDTIMVYVYFDKGKGHVQYSGHGTEDTLSLLNGEWFGPLEPPQ